jgi:hypothetical protein
MDDIFVSLEEIENELKEVEDLGINLSRNLLLLSQKIQYIVSKIKSCETIKAAHDYFVLLEKIQSTLACLVFKEEIGIPTRLRNFVSDFDNLDQDKEYYFKQIKNGEYFFK